jgi:2'-5' RNA ligase
MPFHGVASELDATSDRRMRDLWDELARDFGVRRVAELVPFPHLTYQVADDYDFPRLDAALRALAPTLAPVAVHTTGLGVFAGPSPVLYLAVARTPALDALHGAVWDALGDVGAGLSPYYTPGDAWVPHITLAQFDLTPASLGAIVARLAFRPLAWDVRLESLCVARCDRDDAPCELWRRYPLSAP